MLKRLAQSAVAALVVGAAPLATAGASVTTVCSTGSITVCVDFTLTNIGNTFTLSVKLDAGAPATASLYQFGINATDPAITLSSPTNFQGAPSGWSLITGTCNGLPGLDLCAQGPTGGGGFHFGDVGSFDFTSSSTTFVADLQVHIQDVTPVCSMKVGTQTTDFSTVGANNTGSFNLGDAGEDCGGTTTSTPEPASLWLVGSGLIGVVGAAIRRRRAA